MNAHLASSAVVKNEWNYSSIFHVFIATGTTLLYIVFLYCAQLPVGTLSRSQEIVEKLCGIKLQFLWK